MKGLSLNLKKQDTYGLIKSQPELLNLLVAMLDVDPANRISPDDILKHKLFA